MKSIIFSDHDKRLFFFKYASSLTKEKRNLQKKADVWKQVFRC